MAASQGDLNRVADDLPKLVPPIIPGTWHYALLYSNEVPRATDLAVIAQLEEARAPISSYRERHLAIISPVKSLLPAEVLWRDILLDFTVGLGCTTQQRAIVSAAMVIDAYVFKFLRLPALEELASVAHLQASLVRSLCPIRSLCFCGPPSTPTIVELLRRFPSITELAMIIDSNISRSTVAPHLHCISIGCEQTSKLHYPVYLEMITSRWREARWLLKSAAWFVDRGQLPDGDVLDNLHIPKEDDATEAMNVLVIYSKWV
ncbi:hypothetical protein C8F04DRAFT_1394212 [Mycena alexandri]|uniref:Uncharacterized protein n=1 Tax=Mycena alexandri TaxID=1745969 RepID=A0AAD6SZP9_9AGAR|nr:hypothetical protein C8F04DRAFT_1394212 [Mycena alexandri]